MSFTIDQLVIFAVRAENIQLLEKRVNEGGDINHIDPQHGSALAEVIRKGNLEILNWLISNEVDVNISYHDGIGPLEIALRNPDSEIVYRLVCAGSKLKKKTRPYYQERLECCLKEQSK